MHLLDVNVLIALCDADHVNHDVALSWFRANQHAGWATCPLTENAVLRVIGHHAYPGGPGSPEAVRPLLSHLAQLPGHEFWADAISFRDAGLFADLGTATSKQLTDIYLLALAVHRHAKLATFDQRVAPDLVLGGAEALRVIPPNA